MTSAADLVDAGASEPANPSGSTAQGPDQPAGRRWWRNPANLSLALIPLVAIALPHIYILQNSGGYTDPFFYTGYADSYGDMLTRFGRTYYSTRVTSIWPNALAINLFGDAHYQIVRTFQYLLVGIGGFLAMPRRVAISARVAAAIACMVSIELAYALNSDLTVGAAIAYAFIALGCLLRWRTLWAALAVGVFFSLALNAHESTVYIAIPVLAATAALTLRRGELKRWFAIWACWLAGLLAVQLALSVVMGLAYGWTESNYAFQLYAIRFAAALAEGAAAVWQLPLLNPYTPILAGFMVTMAVSWLLAIRAIRARRADPDVVAPEATPAIWWVVIASTTCYVLVLFSHLVVKTGFTGWPNLVAILLPLTAIAPWLLLLSSPTAPYPNPREIGVSQSVSSEEPPIRGGFAQEGRGLAAIPYAVAAFACLTPVIGAVAESISGVLLGAWIAFAIAAPLLGLIAVLIARKPRTVLIATLACACLVATFNFGPLAASYLGSINYYKTLILDDNIGKDYKLDGRELHELAPKFHTFITESIPPQDSFVIWFPEKPLGLNSIQATMLAESSCLGCGGLGAQFPGLNHAQTQLLDRRDAPGVYHLVVLTTSLAEQQAAQASIKKLKATYPNLAFTPVTSTAFSAGDTSIYVSIDEIHQV